MPKPTPPSALVAAAAAIDEELREYDELASEAKRITLDGEKSLARAARVLERSTTSQPRIHEKLRALVTEIETARDRQQRSLEALVEVAHALEARASEFDGLMKRFAEVGFAAQRVNQGTSQLTELKAGGAPEHELLDGLRALEEQMDGVVASAKELAHDAEQHGWPEIARQADAVRQQVNSANNKLAAAHRSVAARAPS